MVKRVKLLSLVIASLFVGASQAGAYQNGEPGYITTFFSDSSHTTVVGHLYPDCTYLGVQYHQEGTFTYFTEDELVGYCGPSGWEPI